MSRPFLELSSTPPPLFDGTLAMTWKVIMQNNVTGAVVRSVIPGVLYVFILQQDGIGGRVFNWPTNCLNASRLNPLPNATTVLTFIGQQNNILSANIPGTMRP
jgi:hypothetical protein